ncbi:MAG: DUF4293 family protein [Flavobacteriales bacterium]
MLQRLQTLYFILSIGLFFALLSGVDLMTFTAIKEKKITSVDVFGKSVFHLDGTHETLETTQSMPLFLGVFAMIILLFITLMGYKKLSRQLKLARLAMFINVLLVVAFLLWNTFLFGSSSNVSSNGLGMGFYLLVCTVPFTFFGYKGVLNDKRLLDSIDRLR